MLRRLTRRKADVPPQKMPIRWWIRFFVGPVPLQIALTIAFLCLALSAYLATQVVSQQSRIAGTVRQQVTDRHAALYANVRARHDDCEKLNRLRAGLRQVVTEGQAQVPGLKKLFPQLPAAYFRAQRRLYEDELRVFSNDDCRAYALDALPKGSEVRRAAR